MFTIPDNVGTSRAFALAAVLGSAAAFAASDVVAAVANGVMSGATAVAVAGLLVLVVDHDAAIEPATSQYGERSTAGRQSERRRDARGARPAAGACRGNRRRPAPERSAGGRSWRYSSPPLPGPPAAAGSGGRRRPARDGGRGVRPQRRVLAAVRRHRGRRRRVAGAGSDLPPRRRADRKPPPSLSAPNPFDVQRAVAPGRHRSATAPSPPDAFGTGGRRRRCGAMEQVPSARSRLRLRVRGARVRRPLRSSSTRSA